MSEVIVKNENKQLEKFTY